MRVAIVGAGPGGLACALELERRGIYPDIFERSNRVGHPISRVEVLLQLFERPLKNQLHYLLKNYALEFQPLSPLRRVVMHTTRHNATVRGNLGFLVERGQSEEAIEVQLSRKLRTRISLTWKPITGPWPGVRFCCRCRRESSGRQRPACPGNKL